MMSVDLTPSRVDLTPSRIETALRGPLPGLAAQLKMAPPDRRVRPLIPARPAPRRGGVLVLLYPDGGSDDDLHLILTRRTDSVGSHKGQISFPGGKVEPDDPSTVHAALREACEEVGVCSDDLRLLGSLTPLYIPPSHFLIHPHVAYLDHPPSFQPQPSEVAELLEAPLSHFLDAAHVRWEDWTLNGETRRIPFFDVRGHKVWGATAMVLAELAAVMAG